MFFSLGMCLNSIHYLLYVDSSEKKKQKQLSPWKANIKNCPYIILLSMNEIVEKALYLCKMTMKLSNIPFLCDLHNVTFWHFNRQCFSYRPTPRPWAPHKKNSELLVCWWKSVLLSQSHSAAINNCIFRQIWDFERQTKS